MYVNWNFLVPYFAFLFLVFMVRSSRHRLTVGGQQRWAWNRGMATARHGIENGLGLDELIARQQLPMCHGSSWAVAVETISAVPVRFRELLFVDVLRTNVADITQQIAVQRLGTLTGGNVMDAAFVLGVADAYGLLHIPAWSLAELNEI